MSQNPIREKVGLVILNIVGNFENTSWIQTKMEEKVIGAYREVLF
jgi:hypothetical protein